MKSVTLTVPRALWDYINEHCPSEKRDDFWRLCHYHSRAKDGLRAMKLTILVLPLIFLAMIITIPVHFLFPCALAGVWLWCMYDSGMYWRQSVFHLSRITDQEILSWKVIGRPVMAIEKEYRVGDPIHTFTITLPGE